MPSSALRSAVPPPDVELRPGTVATAAAAAALAAGAALTSLTYGWSYMIAALVGAAAAALLTWRAWRRCPAERVADRGALLFATTLALALFAVYAADALDWRPFGIDDATAGLAVGFVLLAAIPCRYALRRADVMPSAAGVTIAALIVALVAWALVLDPTGAERPDDPAHALLLGFPARGAAVLIAGLGFVFALRRALYGTALLLLVAIGLTCVALWSVGHLGDLAAFGAGGVAVAAMLAALVRRRRADAGRPLASAEPLLIPVAAFGAAALAVGLTDVGLVAAAAALAAWWFYLRRRLARSAGAAFVPVTGSQLALRLGLAAGLGATVYAHALLVEAAISNYTGPMLLAELRDRGLYAVSDLRFAAALVDDQYLWRDEVMGASRGAAASPGGLIEASRYHRDGWSTAVPLGREPGLVARESRGYGYVVRIDGHGQLRVADVFDGSPAHAAGVRRGDIVRAIDGIAVEPDALPPTRGRESIRLELVGPDGAGREAVVTRGRHAIPSVAAARVIETGDRRVGYIALRHFVGTTRAEFDAAALRLRGRGIADLVLDLRMNGGGSLQAAGQVASTIAGRRADGRMFIRLVHNERHRDNDTDTILGAPSWGGLSLVRLVVITSPETCSAAEVLIHGLAPHIEVITIGATTCGKPVGAHVLRYGDVSYWVITFKDINARGEGDFYAGLRPRCAAEDDLGRALGDTEEASLKAALYYLRFGGCAPA